jgi:hypothetical protein
MPLVGVNNEPLLERAIFGFDGTSYRVVKIDGDGNLVAALKASQEIEVVQDTAADLKATVSVAASQEIEVTQPTAADLKATVSVAASQEIEVTQDTFADLKATTEGTGRIPPGVTDLTATYLLSVANGYYIELLSNSTASTFAGLSGRTVADGKTLCVAWANAFHGVSTGKAQFWLGHGSTYVLIGENATPSIVFAPTVVYECVGDGSKVWKIAACNYAGVTNTLAIVSLCWEEDT